MQIATHHDHNVKQKKERFTLKRQYFYLSIEGLTEEQLQEELSKFMNELTMKYDNKKFGATVLGMTEQAGKRVEKMLYEE